MYPVLSVSPINGELLMDKGLDIVCLLNVRVWPRKPNKYTTLLRILWEPTRRDEGEEDAGIKANTNLMTGHVYYCLPVCDL